MQDKIQELVGKSLRINEVNMGTCTGVENYMYTGTTLFFENGAYVLKQGDIITYETPLH